jgi:hypothetical protein
VLPDAVALTVTDPVIVLPLLGEEIATAMGVGNADPTPPIAAWIPAWAILTELRKSP